MQIVKKKINNNTNTGITLIALVITIIVLLILAGISISMLSGDNSILRRAGDAKNSIDVAEEKEKVQLAYTSAIINDLDGTITEDDLRNELDKICGDIDKEPSDKKTEVKLISKDNYTVLFKDTNNRFNLENGIVTLDNTDYSRTLANQITEANYGDKVNYSISVGNTELTDWKILYKDDSNNVFIMYADYLPSNVLNAIKDKIGIDYSTSAVYWKTIPDELQENSQNSLFMFTKFTLNDSRSSKIVSTLLNTNNWKDFVDKTQGATYAIGAPTLEMILKSWNEKYSDTLYCTANENGYLMAKSENESLSTSLPIKTTNGYDTLYMPYKVKTNNCNGYWISSVVYQDNYPYLSCLNFQNGVVYDLMFSAATNNSYTNQGLRPVICLNSKTYAQQQNGIWLLDE